jgi:hypothetical protein
MPLASHRSLGASARRRSGASLLGSLEVGPKRTPAVRSSSLKAGYVGPAERSPATGSVHQRAVQRRPIGNHACGFGVRGWRGTALPALRMVIAGWGLSLGTHPVGARDRSGHSVKPAAFASPDFVAQPIRSGDQRARFDSGRLTLQAHPADPLGANPLDRKELAVDRRRATTPGLLRMSAVPRGSVDGPIRLASFPWAADAETRKLGAETPAESHVELAANGALKKPAKQLAPAGGEQSAELRPGTLSARTEPLRWMARSDLPALPWIARGVMGRAMGSHRQKRQQATPMASSRRVEATLN